MEFTYISSGPATSASTITIGNTDLHQRFFLDSVAVIQGTPLQYNWSTGDNTEFITVTPDQIGDIPYSVTASNNSGYSESRNINITVTECGFEDDACHPWTLVTNALDLTAGSDIVIAAKDADYALGSTQNNNNRSAAAIVRTDNHITIDNDVQIIHLEAGIMDNTFAFNVGNGYLYAASSSKNYLKTQINNNDNGLWKIQIGQNGIAIIKAQGTNSRNWLRFHIPPQNPGLNNPDTLFLFSCYSETSEQQDIVIYKRQPLSSHGDTSVTASSSHCAFTTPQIHLPA